VHPEEDLVCALHYEAEGEVEGEMKDCAEVLAAPADGFQADAVEVELVDEVLLCILD
jgi:hypothetical protein